MSTLCEKVASGSTAISAARLGRNFIGAELGADEFDIAVKRIEDALKV